MKQKLRDWSIFIASVGILIFAMVVPPYTGATYFTSKKNQPKFDFRRKAGNVANILIIIGTAGQLFSLCMKDSKKQERN